MGKNSLIKSTSKKKTASKKEAVAKKAKKVIKTSPKTTAKASPKTKTTVTPPKKQVTIQELLAKKFDTRKPDKLFRVQDASRQAVISSAPPSISASDPAEAARLKALLLKKFDYEMLVKAAAEKAAAEKAAAEKAAAEKAAAEQKASISYQPPAETKPSDPAEKVLKYGIAAFVLLILLVIGSSFMNTRNFYIKPIDGATEIWQGKFAPKGAKLLISLPGMLYTDPVKDVYSKGDVIPLIFNYYIEKADTLLDVPGLPDFEGVKSYLNQALAYGTEPELAATARSRLNIIDLMVLLSKADVAASKDTIDGLEASLKYLKEAYGFEMDPLQKERIVQKTAAASARLQTLKAQAAAPQEKKAGNPEPTGETKTAD